MIELPLVLVAGLLGSSHCVGMCGPFALALGGGAPNWRINLARQLVYGAGRIFTYSVIGAVCGYCGLRFSHWAESLVNAPAVLALLAGALLVLQGLASAGVLGRRRVSAAAGPCLAGSFFAAFLASPGRGSVFLAGMFTGMLPCGLVYAMAALAASSADMATGALIMAVFGLGTVPVMVATGCGASLLTLAARRKTLKVAAWCVVLAGVMSLVRGVGFAGLPWTPASIHGAAARCPLCPDEIELPSVDRPQKGD